MWARKNRLWFQFQERGEEAFPVASALAASLIPLPPNLLLGVWYLTPNLSWQRLLALNTCLPILSGCFCKVCNVFSCNCLRCGSPICATASSAGPQASWQSVLSPNNSSSLGHVPFPQAFHSEDGVIVKGNRCFPERRTLLVLLIIILYLQYASAAI